MARDSKNSRNLVITASIVMSEKFEAKTKMISFNLKGKLHEFFENFCFTIKMQQKT